jgi:hypothetical protein
MRYSKKTFSGLCITLLMLIAWPEKAAAQIIDNKMNLQAGLLYGGLQGNSTIAENGFLLPSLFGNTNEFSGFALKATYKLKPVISIGAGYSQRQIGRWSYLEDNTYTGANINQSVVSFSALAHTPFLYFGFLNRVRLFAELSPEFGISDLKLKAPIMTIQGATQSEVSPMKESSGFYGFKATAGLNVLVAPKLGLYASWSFHENRVKGLLFSDERFGGQFFELGLSYRLLENRKFYYIN